VALALAIGLSAVVAQDVPPRSSSEQLNAAKAVEVEVSGRDENGISGVSVKLTSLGRQGEVKTAITDSSGRVRFEGQPDGLYWLDISGPLVYDHGVVDVSPGHRGFGLGLREIDGKPVMLDFVYTSAPPGIICTLPCFSPPIIETEMWMSEDKLVLPPALPVVSLVPPRVQRRNPIARFFSALGHQLGF